MSGFYKYKCNTIGNKPRFLPLGSHWDPFENMVKTKNSLSAEKIHISTLIQIFSVIAGGS